MGAILIRGISPVMQKWIQKLAEKENLSVNQTLILLLKESRDRRMKQQEIEETRAEAFRRIDAIRAELHKKYGKFDDSTKIVREARDSR